MLFRSWFSAFSLSPNSPRVNSEFGEIPEDFAVVKVGSLPMLVTDYVANGSFASLKANVNLYQEPNYAYFIRNTDLKSGSFGVFVDQHSYEFLSKSTLYGGEIIISNVGDVGSVFLCPKLDGRMTLGNNIIMLRPCLLCTSTRSLYSSACLLYDCSISSITSSISDVCSKNTSTSPLPHLPRPVMSLHSPFGS